MLEGIKQLLGIGATERELKEAFELGKRAGIEEGIQQERDRKIKITREVSPKEAHEVCTFLAERNIEMRYNPWGKGLEIRKRINNNTQR